MFVSEVGVDGVSIQLGRLGTPENMEIAIRIGTMSAVAIYD